jgi:signal transduction histidine kinase
MNATELEARAAFFSKAHHGVRQRLHAMRLLTQATLDTLGPEADSPLARLTEVADDLDAYIAGVFDFARLDTPYWQPSKAPVDLQDIFQALDLHFEDLAFRRGVRLVFRPTPLSLLTDADRLRRILEQLVSNAIRLTRGRVLVAARPRGPDCMIEVWDQGPGVQPGAEQAIFEAFYQDRRAGHAEGPQGPGLGLTWVLRLADSLGYPVTLRSVLGKGSVMRLLIPARDLRGNPWPMNDAT